MDQSSIKRLHGVVGPKKGGVDSSPQNKERIEKVLKMMWMRYSVKRASQRKKKLCKRRAERKSWLDMAATDYALVWAE